MAELPYMTGYGVTPKILDKIIGAKTPERFTQDFLATKLGFPGGSRMPIIPLLKKLGFIESSGTPTALYNKFRNDTSRGSAMAEGLRRGYSELFSTNEYAQDLPKEKLRAQIIQLTGAEKNSPKVSAIACTFEASTEPPPIIGSTCRVILSRLGTMDRRDLYGTETVHSGADYRALAPG